MKAISDPRFPFLLMGKPPRRQAVHDEVVAKLVRCVFYRLSRDVNYDHVSLSVPRCDLPLSYDGHRYDLSFLYRDHIVFVEVRTVKVSRRQLEEGDLHG